MIGSSSATKGAIRHRQLFKAVYFNLQVHMNSHTYSQAHTKMTTKYSELSSFVYRYIPNGCEVDLKIPETFSLESLVEFIDSFIEVYVQTVILMHKL